MSPPKQLKKKKISWTYKPSTIGFGVGV